MQKLREYALVGNDNVVYLLNMETRVIRKLLSADSHAIGIYYDETHNYYFFLTKNLMIFYYNRTTYTLEWIGDFQDACDILSLDEIIDNIFVKNGLLGSKNDANQFLRPNDFETFLKIC